MMMVRMMMMSGDLSQEHEHASQLARACIPLAALIALAQLAGKYWLVQLGTLSGTDMSPITYAQMHAITGNIPADPQQ